MIPTKVHGMLDYIVGVVLILAPMIFGFASLGGAAVLIPEIIGVGLIIYSIFTDYELGLVKVLPIKWHLVLDFVAAALLALSPWLFGFTGAPANAWIPHLVVGIAVILVVLLSSKTLGGEMGGETTSEQPEPMRMD